ncbi:MAG: DNA-binding transcriptional regulator [Planctomycetota bacterium]
MPQKNIALLIETSRSYGRGLLQGVASYARLRSDWNLLHQEQALVERVPDWFHDWNGDGILARIETMEVAEAVLERGTPVVDLRSRFRITGLASVDTDPIAVAELALQHLLERGVKRFAFCGYPSVDFSAQRGGHFKALAEDRGYPVEVFEAIAGDDTPPANHIEAELRGTLNQDDLCDWVRSLEKPVGVLCSNDVRGRQLIQACHQANVSVPDEMLIVGMDNDEVVCNLANPSLSSVSPAVENLGFEAAAMLQRMMDGEPVPRKVYLNRPTHVEARKSTDTVATDDETVIQALSFIRDHACAGINVQDVLQDVGISRSTLERRFLEVIGRTPKEQITQERIGHVKRLLTETKFPLSRIARVTGFKTASHLSVAFKQHAGVTPSAYRQ